MGRYYDAFKAVIVEMGLKFNEAENDVIKMWMGGKNGSWPMICQVHEARDQIIVYSMLPQKAEEARRADIAEYIARANYGLDVGNFEIDFRDGEIRFKTAIDVEGVSTYSTMMKTMITRNMFTFDRYFTGFNAVLYGGKDPKEAVADIES